MNKGRTHFERVVGGSEADKEIATQELQSIFDERSEKMAGYEIEKTEEDIALLEKTTAIVDGMIKDYGGDPKPLPPDHVYILKPGSVLAMTGGKLAGGIHKPLGVKVGIEKGDSRLLFASGMAHELFHLKSYKSARVGKSGEDVRLYRSGLSMFDRKDATKEFGEEKEYFAMMEEAIVAECTKKFLERLKEDDGFREDARAVAKIRDWVARYYRRSGMSEEKTKAFEDELKYIADPIKNVERIEASSDNENEREAYAAGMFKALYEKGGVEPLERYRERKMLYDLLDTVVTKSEGRFKSRDEIFDEFAKANFTGNYLSLARIAESILGKGTFRKLAEKFSKESEKEEHETSEQGNPST